MIGLAKAALRRGLYAGGLLSLWHRRRNAHGLTVAMFHRVLPKGDARWTAAEAEYTIEADLFAACLRFFKRHYTPIRLADLRDSGGALERLPPCPLLVTFDDGWADNLTVALPILEREGCPALVFVAAGVLDDPRAVWWHDLVAHAFGAGLPSGPALAPLRELLGGLDDGASPPGGNAFYAALIALQALPAGERDRLLAPIAALAHFAPPRQMLDEAGLRALAESPWIEIGAHGATHLPLTRMAAPLEDLHQARDRLTRALGEAAGRPRIDSLSFPHGQWSQALLDQACGLGYRFFFTSDQRLERTASLAETAIGRLDIATRHVLGPAGTFAPDRLAERMFLQG